MILKPNDYTNVFFGSPKNKADGNLIFTLIPNWIEDSQIVGVECPSVQSFAVFEMHVECANDYKLIKQKYNDGKRDRSRNAIQLQRGIHICCFVHSLNNNKNEEKLNRHMFQLMPELELHLFATDTLCRYWKSIVYSNFECLYFFSASLFSDERIFPHIVVDCFVCLCNGVYSN